MQPQIPVVSQMEDAVTSVCWVLWIQEAILVTVLKKWHLEKIYPIASSEMVQEQLQDLEYHNLVTI